MPSKQRARGCHASETLHVGQANRQPQKTKKILEPARIETVSKNFQKRYNRNWEEVHGHASLRFLAEFKRGIALLPILFKPFQSLNYVMQKSSLLKMSSNESLDLSLGVEAFDWAHKKQQVPFLNEPSCLHAYIGASKSLS